MKLAVDTYCWVELLQGGPKCKAVSAALERKGVELMISSITLVELSAKLHSVGRGEDVSKVLASVSSKARVVHPDESIAMAAGGLWAKHHAESNAGIADCAIAATAQANGAVVLTGDKHFKSFRGVDVELI